MIFQPKLCAFIGTLFLASHVMAEPAIAGVNPISLEQAIQQAIQNDPWLIASEQKQAAALSMSEGAAVLPDPKFNVGLMNLPTDTFDLEQEGMTQIQLGVSQMLPRGDTLKLQSERLRQQGALMPVQREQRRAQVRLMLSQLWFDALKASHSIALIEDNRVLFEQLTDIVSSSYSSTFGKTRQQDLVRAQLELDRLDDRLVQLHQQQVSAGQKLAEWLDVTQPPQIETSVPELALQLPNHDQHLIQHPEVRQFDQAIRVADTEVSLAEQKYEPEWMINASYGFRGDDPMGNDRADLFSLGVSVDVPLFSSKRQDAQVRAETHEVEALKTERLLAIRNLRARYYTLKAELFQQDERLALYEERLLPGLNQSAEAAINAYTSDDGNFADVVQARISELNAKLTVLNIRLERSKKLAELQYLLAGNLLSGRAGEAQ
ncbi:TolC family protein [Neptunomonas phycophila]|uniref:TolC family protein n=1 Tax=Neptunomonas phycophila TaxID=1572645 RepID=UPI0030F9E948